ncbi:hypothetical protein I302_106866 [Kwoniella bestiolae CBS 10118]|uniref:Uncharacterized protein n=1 Tax=Kwoniella bestiolae CBS 10118 TaxID=1296100 RepID=A0A1B9G070_9TREE|nr:hypothetical protein I302_05868 [Kwoniella bestiolae CBS 10118]OCF24408.1 hypothetical protein I302_05868 [Kwoniella bestiolae CBS 10118]
MSPPILSSPFLNLNTINSILSSPSPIPTEQRIQLLEAKVHLLTSSLPPLIKPPTPQGASEIPDEKSKRDDKRDKAMFEIDKIRIALGRSYLQQKVPDHIKAEMEFGVVDRNCKGIIKRIEKSTSRSDGGINIDALTREPDKHWVEDVKLLRIDALKGMISVEEGLGRSARAERWRKTIEEIEQQE